MSIKKGKEKENENKLVETRVSFLEERYEEVNQKIENLQLSLTEKNKKYSSDILELQEIQKKQERKEVGEKPSYIHYFADEYEPKGFRLNSGVSALFSKYAHENKLQVQAELSQALFEYLLKKDKNFANEIGKANQ